MAYKVLYCVGNLYIPFRRELELLQEGKVAKALTYELWVQFLVTGSHIFSFLCFIYNLTSNNPYYVYVLLQSELVFVFTDQVFTVQSQLDNA